MTPTAVIGRRRVNGGLRCLIPGVSRRFLDRILPADIHIPATASVKRKLSPAWRSLANLQQFLSFPMTGPPGD